MKMFVPYVNVGKGQGCVVETTTTEVESFGLNDIAPTRCSFPAQELWERLTETEAIDRLHAWDVDQVSVAEM